MYPSFYQFRYFFRKYNSKQTEFISRNGLSYYQRNQRPLTGDGVQAFAPNVGVGMLDATTLDIYLINEAGGIVGRPIVYDTLKLPKKASEFPKISKGISLKKAGHIESPYHYNYPLFHLSERKWNLSAMRRWKKWQRRWQ